MFHVNMSIRQLLRTPVKTLLFVLLLAAVTIMLVFGSVLYLQTQAHIEAVEDQFTTIGMVTQRPSSTQTITREFGCGVTETAIYDVYDELIPVDVLNFEGANYIRPPEERLFYMGRISIEGSAVLNGGIKFISRNPGPNDPALVELEALEDSTLGSPTAMKLIQQRYGYKIMDDPLYLCQHYAGEPIPIQAGEKYMAVVQREFCSEHSVSEYFPLPALYSSQYNPDGTPVEGNAPKFHLFYQNKEGSWVTSHTPGGSSADFERVELTIQHEDDNYSFTDWFGWLQTLLNRDTYYPAIATDSLDLVPSYQSKRMKIMDGRAITQEEFDEGAHVCMIPESWNRGSNQFSPGITSYVQFPISVALKNYPASKFDILGNDSYFEYFSFFDSDGYSYVTFAGGAYQIVGTFNLTNLDSIDTGDIDIATNCMIIPAKSLLKQQENIAYYGPMTGTYVSFQIPNGTIAEFDQKLHEMVPEAGDLDIAYSDNGYEQVMPSLERTRTAALLLCGVGAVSAIAVIVLLLYFFIIRERRRTAIERGLGMTKRQCRVSLMAGILILALMGCFLGTTVGVVMVSAVDLDGGVGQEASYSVFLTKFSDWTNKWNQVTAVQDAASIPLAAVALGVPLALIVFLTVLSLVMVGFNLRVEPIVILGGKEAT